MVSTVPLTFSGFPRLAQPSVHMCVVLSHRDIRTAKCTQEFRELKPNVQQGLCQQRPGPLQRLGAPEMSDGGQGGNTGVCLSVDHRGQAGIQALWNPESARRSQERNQDLSLKVAEARAQGLSSFLQMSSCCLREKKVCWGNPFSYFYLFIMCVSTHAHECTP